MPPKSTYEWLPPAKYIWAERKREAEVFVADLRFRHNYIYDNWIMELIETKSNANSLSDLYEILYTHKDEEPKDKRTTGKSKTNFANAEDYTFFRRYNKQSLYLDRYPSREKVLHLAVVFGIDPDVLLAKFNYRTLSAANLFECTLAYHAKKHKRQMEQLEQLKGNMEQLEQLYKKVQSKLAENISVVPDDVKKKMATGRADSSAIVSSEINSIFAKIEADDDDKAFLEAVETYASLFRFHSRSLEHMFQTEKEQIENALKTHLYLEHSALSTLLYESFNSATGWGTKRSFIERLRFVLSTKKESKHKKQPSRELLILVHLLYQCICHHEFPNLDELNAHLNSLGLPQLNEIFIFDKVIKRIISYSILEKEDPYLCLMELINIYQSAYQEAYNSFIDSCREEDRRRLVSKYPDIDEKKLAEKCQKAWKKRHVKRNILACDFVQTWSC